MGPFTTNCTKNTLHLTPWPYDTELSARCHSFTNLQATSLDNIETSGFGIVFVILAILVFAGVFPATCCCRGKKKKNPFGLVHASLLVSWSIALLFLALLYSSELWNCSNISFVPSFDWNVAHVFSNIFPSLYHAFLAAYLKDVISYQKTLRLAMDSNNRKEQHYNDKLEWARIVFWVALTGLLVSLLKFGIAVLDTRGQLSEGVWVEKSVIASLETVKNKYNLPDLLQNLVVGLAYILASQVAVIEFVSKTARGRVVVATQRPWSLGRLARTFQSAETAGGKSGRTQKLFPSPEQQPESKKHEKEHLLGSGATVSYGSSTTDQEAVRVDQEAIHGPNNAQLAADPPVDHATTLLAVAKSMYWLGIVGLMQCAFEMYHLYYADSVRLEIELVGLALFRIWPAFYILRQLVWPDLLHGRYTNLAVGVMWIFTCVLPAMLAVASLSGRLTCEEERWPANESMFRPLGTELFMARFAAGPIGPLTFLVFLFMCQGLLTYISGELGAFVPRVTGSYIKLHTILALLLAIAAGVHVKAHIYIVTEFRKLQDTTAMANDDKLKKYVVALMCVFEGNCEGIDTCRFYVSWLTGWYMVAALLGLCVQGFMITCACKCRRCGAHTAESGGNKKDAHCDCPAPCGLQHTFVRRLHQFLAYSFLFALSVHSFFHVLGSWGVIVWCVMTFLLWFVIEGYSFHGTGAQWCNRFAICRCRPRSLRFCSMKQQVVVDSIQFDNGYVNSQAIFASLPVGERSDGLFVKGKRPAHSDQGKKGCSFSNGKVLVKFTCKKGLQLKPCQYVLLSIYSKPEKTVMDAVKRWCDRLCSQDFRAGNHPFTCFPWPVQSENEAELCFGLFIDTGMKRNNPHECKKERNGWCYSHFVNFFVKLTSNSNSLTMSMFDGDGADDPRLRCDTRAETCQPPAVPGIMARAFCESRDAWVVGGLDSELAEPDFVQEADVILCTCTGTGITAFLGLLADYLLHRGGGRYAGKLIVVAWYGNNECVVDLICRAMKKVDPYRDTTDAMGSEVERADGSLAMSPPLVHTAMAPAEKSPGSVVAAVPGGEQTTGAAVVDAAADGSQLKQFQTAGAPFFQDLFSIDAEQTATQRAGAGEHPINQYFKEAAKRPTTSAFFVAVKQSRAKDGNRGAARFGEQLGELVLKIKTLDQGLVPRSWNHGHCGRIDKTQAKEPFANTLGEAGIKTSRKIFRESFE